MPYLTPSNAPTTSRGVIIYIPDNDEFIHTLLGALLELTKVENWEQSGTLTEEETAELWRSVYDYTVATSIYP